MKGIIILGQSYSGVLTPQILKEMANAIKKLPEPAIVPVAGANLASEEVLLCLQRETIYVDQFNPNNAIKYMGSKRVEECIVVYIHSETDHLVVHVDNTESLDFTQQIEYFNYKTKLRVTLAGGTLSKDSEENLCRILLALNKVSEKLDIEITIEFQKIIENNCFTKEDEYDYIYDKCIEKIDIISRQFFGKPFDTKFFANRSAQDFKTRSVKGKISQDILMTMTAMFARVAEIYNTDPDAMRDMLFSGFKQRVPTEQKFIEVVDGMFSREGFGVYSMGFRVNKLFASASLSSFVFDLHGAKIYRLSAHRETQEETKRLMRIMDPFQEKRYHLFYNGRFNQLILPALSGELVTKCRTLKARVKDNCLDRSLYAKLLAVTEIEYQKIVARFIKTIEAYEAVCLTSKCVFFGSKRSALHLLVETESPRSLSELNELSGCKFTAVKREYPGSTIDAVYLCESNEKVSAIHDKLNANGIISCIEKCAEDKYRIIVPAINVGHYAQAIYAAQSKSLISTAPKSTLTP